MDSSGLGHLCWFTVHSEVPEEDTAITVADVQTYIGVEEELSVVWCEGEEL